MWVSSGQSLVFLARWLLPLPPNTRNTEASLVEALKASLEPSGEGTLDCKASTKSLLQQAGEVKTNIREESFRKQAQTLSAQCIGLC